MRNLLLLERFMKGSLGPRSSPISPAAAASATNSSIPFSLCYRRNAASAPSVEDEAETIAFPREDPRISHGLNWALAGRGVIVKDKAFQNLKPFELQQKGATIAGSLSGLPVHVRGNILEGSTEISRAHFSKLLKQVTSHISTISDIFVHDGAIGSTPKCDVNVRIISDNPSAVLSLSRILWRTPTRAVSHDSCPLTIYVATSISASAGDILGLGTKGNIGFIAADVERSSLILCGKAYSDVKGTKEALALLSGPIISSRGGLFLSSRLLVTGDSVILLFAPGDIIQSCSDQFISGDIGVILSSEGVSPLFQSGNSGGSYSSKLPDAVIFVSSDGSRTIPSASKLSPGQAAYHFLAGYQNGKFLPAYSKGPSAVDPLELAKAFLSKARISLSWRNQPYPKKFRHLNLKVDISERCTKASYPANFDNSLRNSHFEILHHNPCFCCGCTKALSTLMTPLYVGSLDPLQNRTSCSMAMGPISKLDFVVVVVVGIVVVHCCIFQWPTHTINGVMSTARSPFQ